MNVFSNCETLDMKGKKQNKQQFLFFIFFNRTVTEDKLTCSDYQSHNGAYVIELVIIHS